MASLQACREAVADALAAGIPGLRTSATFVSGVNPPMAVVLPQPGQAIEFATLDGGVNYLLRVTVVTGAVNDDTAQNNLDAYLATTGPSSIEAIFHTNPTLSGTIDWVIIQAIHSYGLIEWGGIQYTGANLNIQVAASTP